MKSYILVEVDSQFSGFVAGELIRSFPGPVRTADMTAYIHPVREIENLDPATFVWIVPPQWEDSILVELS